MKLPQAFCEMLGDRPFEEDHWGKSGSKIRLFDGLVLKAEPQGEETEQAVAMMRYLEGKLPVPRVIRHETVGGISYLLMTRMKGRMLCDEFYMKRPALLAQLLARGLRMLWSIDISDCPVQSGLDEKLRRARLRVEQGLVDMQDSEPGTYGPEGFSSPAQLLDWLEDHRPEEEPVLSHGDYCLPNLFAMGHTLSGFIDLGRAGTADRWQDIALCYRSLKHNADGTFGAVYEGFSPELLFESLQMEPDWEKIRYYILLDELF